MIDAGIEQAGPARHRGGALELFVGLALGEKDRVRDIVMKGVERHAKSLIKPVIEVTDPVDAETMAHQCRADILRGLYIGVLSHERSRADGRHAPV